MGHSFCEFMHDLYIAEIATGALFAIDIMGLFSFTSIQRAREKTM